MWCRYKYFIYVQLQYLDTRFSNHINAIAFGCVLMWIQSGETIAVTQPMIINKLLNNI